MIDDLVGSRTPAREQVSDERYFLSSRSDASVKVRDGLMDVKVLLDVDDNGVQLWTPTLKATFPVSIDDARTVLSALGIEPPDDLNASYSMEALTELIEVQPDLFTVAVHKERTHYDLDGCAVEVTEVGAAGLTTRTATIESTDPSRVIDTVRRCGCAGRRNVPVASGLKSLAGIGARRLAVIDVGTNSVKFHIGERRVDGSLHTIADRSVVTRLGQEQPESGVLADEPVSRTVAAVVAMVDEARGLGLDVVAVGTAGLRRAPNRSVVVDAVRDRTGVVVEVISGEEEARLAYIAATGSLPRARGRLVVFDSGGGSTQFTFGENEDVGEQFSLDVGAGRVAERFGLDRAVSSDDLDEALAWVAAEFDRLDGRPRPDAVVAIGGTVTNLAAVVHGLAEYDPDVVHGTIVDHAELDRQIELYRNRTADERRTIAGLQPARAEVILGGASIVRTILDKLGHDSMTVSDRGLRHGVLISRLPARSPSPNGGSAAGQPHTGDEW
ncbi:Ppx/GppA family phosphatase [Ilumatobacter sp.]|uniref:Ppx/GppA phosphatase family protein n=1 Tax=Ilumatobacter sp. TaxID=1967498 RepID=UPI003C6F3380